MLIGDIPKNESGSSRGRVCCRIGTDRPWALSGMLPWETRTVSWTGRGRSSETTDGGDAGVDVLSKKKRKPHPHM